MLIILAVIVVIGVVFLLIYNSRSSRKAAEARASKIAEVDKGPVLLHEEDEAQKKDRNHESAKHTAHLEHGEHRQAEVHPTEETMEKIPAAQKKEARGTDGDQAYRQALLHFRKPTETGEKLPLTDTNEVEKSADEVYRSVLRAMKNKSEGTSSDRK
ncbi:hypothetical protein ACFTRD_06815 [Paenibacillus sp. NPDC056933]|uniref:hypothetical protein n=1 Tax=Paenibacillus sp. NPDC056933 TaxID=3345968 RepID=UPI003643B3B2